MVNVKNAATIDPIEEHNGTVTSWFLVGMEEMRDATAGSFLQFIDEFEVAAGVAIEPHHHNTHEFYYVLDGGGEMRVGTGRQDIAPRDLVHIPPNEPHTLRGGPDGVRCLAFAASFQAPGEGHTPTEMPD